MIVIIPDLRCIYDHTTEDKDLLQCCFQINCLHTALKSSVCIHLSYRLHADSPQLNCVHAGRLKPALDGCRDMPGFYCTQLFQLQCCPFRCAVHIGLHHRSDHPLALSCSNAAY